MRRFFTAASVRRTAKSRFGWSSLRPGQLDAVCTLLNGTDALVVMPTGAGKSAVYQLAGLLIDGPTVVVSPLIALQRDQLAGIAARGGAGAVAVNSAQRAGETDQAWESLSTGDAEFVFLSPEQLANDAVVDRLAKAKVSLLVVDEAHCVSSWGHDFRPDYLRIGDVVERLGRPRIVALTATASPPVRAEIVERLHLRRPKQIIQNFDRPNLTLDVERFVEARHKEQAVVERVAAQPGTGLVYTATRKEAERYAAELIGAGKRARAYHAGMKAADREEVHQQFLADELDVVVATNAFGMGIDKPDVRYVVHASVSESLDSYYQEIGRAGRDGKPALALLLYRAEDLGLRNFFASGGADEEVLTEVAGAVREHTRGEGAADPSQLKQELELSHSRLTNAVNLLEQAGAVTVDPAGLLHYSSPRRRLPDAVHDAVEVAEARQRMDKSRVEMMRGYAETTGCRRQFLLGYFGEAYPNTCGNCDVCRSGAATSAAVPAQARARKPKAAKASPYPVNTTVEHREWGEGVVMRVEPDRITVLFESVGYRTLALKVLQGDAGLLTSKS